MTRRSRKIIGPFAIVAAVMPVIASIAVPSSAKAEESSINTVLFGSMDTGTSLYASAGFKTALDPIGRDGFVLLAAAGAGARVERGTTSVPGPLPVLLRTVGAAGLLGGYQFFFDWGVVGLFAGPEVSFESLIGLAGIGPVEARFGVRLQGEVWARPTEETLATVTVVMGSARWDAYGRVSAGYRAFGAYLGPEASAYADRTGYAKVAFGAHATDFGFDDFRFRFSGGCSYEAETRRIGPYVALSGWMPL